MKYLKIAVPTILLTSIGLFYFIIPSTIKISTFQVSAAHELTAVKLLNNPSLLLKSMSPCYNSKQQKIILNEVAFTANAALSNIVQLDAATKNLKTKTFITANAINKETTALNWFAEIKTSWNPIQRFSDYQEAVKIKKATAQLLVQISNFIEKPVNIYGWDIKEITLKDTVLITTKFISKQLPSNNQIYEAVDKLNQYLTHFQCKAINHPMVTILDNNTNDYTVMVGISIDKEIPETDKFRIKRMPVNGKMFVADVFGGPSTIRNGYDQLKTFLIDSKRPSPAVPFELLQTDRRKLTDTLQWETRIYYPVM